MVQGPVRPIQPTTRDPEEIDLGDGHRVGKYTEYRAFARGQQWTDKPLPGEIRHTYNYAGALLRKTASYLFPTAPTFNLGDQASDQAAEQLLANTISALNLDELDLELEIEAATIGDAAIKVTWDTATSQPRVVSVDPGSLIATWSPDNPFQAHTIAQAYELPGYAITALGQDFGAIEDHRTYRVDEVWSRTTWSIQVGDVAHRRANPYGWIPYVVLRNRPHLRRFWGRSDLDDLVDAQRELNRKMSTLSTIMRMSGAPIAVIEGVDASQGLSSRPGAKWELPEGSKAYLLDLLGGNGVRLHVDYVDQLRTSIHDLSETPKTAFGDSGRDLSGAALEVEIQPLVQRVRRKRLSWNRFYDERNRRLLDLLGKYSGVDAGTARVTTTIWPPILPSDDHANAQTQVALVAGGIRSRHTAISHLGEKDPQDEIARIDADHQAEQQRAIELVQAQPARPGDDASQSKPSSMPKEKDA